VDWIDPETWKRPAELAGYWREIGAGVVALLTLLGSVTQKGRESSSARTVSASAWPNASVAFFIGDNVGNFDATNSLCNPKVSFE